MSNKNLVDLDKVVKSVKNALEEDIGTGDITGQLINPTYSQEAILICREESILCGTQWFEKAFDILDSNVKISWNFDEGSLIKPNDEVAVLYGNSKSMVAAERTGLNFLQMMSGIAYKTYSFQKYLDGSRTRLLDTRKTLPGLRYEQKYSVLIGGGQNHRMGLYDAALVKENHIASCGSIELAINELRKQGSTIIEVEVESIEDLKEAIQFKADIAMLDNFSDEKIDEAVDLAKDAIKLEISGNIDFTSLPKLIKHKVDFISSGDLTKNITAADYSLIFKPID